MGFLGAVIMQSLMQFTRFCFKKLPTRKATWIRFVILGVLCAFLLTLTIVLWCAIPEFWWLYLITPGAVLCALIWRCVWDGVLLVKNDFDTPPDASAK